MHVWSHQLSIHCHSLFDWSVSSLGITALVSHGISGKNWDQNHHHEDKTGGNNYHCDDILLCIFVPFLHVLDPQRLDLMAECFTGREGMHQSQPQKGWGLWQVSSWIGNSHRFFFTTTVVYLEKNTLKFHPQVLIHNQSFPSIFQQPCILHQLPASQHWDADSSMALDTVVLSPQLVARTCND